MLYLNEPLKTQVPKNKSGHGGGYKTSWRKVKAPTDDHVQQSSARKDDLIFYIEISYRGPVPFGGPLPLLAT